MKRVLKEKWMAALKSGDFIQGHGYLKKKCRNMEGKDELNFCCIGVLLDSAGFKWQEESPYLSSRGAFHYVKNGVTCGLAGLREPELQELGLVWENIEVSLDGKLMTMNDCGNNNFSQIAEWIKENVPEEE